MNELLIQRIQQPKLGPFQYQRKVTSTLNFVHLNEILFNYATIKYDTNTIANPVLLPNICQIRFDCTDKRMLLNKRVMDIDANSKQTQRLDSFEQHIKPVFSVAASLSTHSSVLSII